MIRCRVQLRRAVVLFAVIAAIVAMADLPALADDPPSEPPPTTEPAPEPTTTLPETTTTLPETTTTTEPASDPTTTTETTPDSTTTTTDTRARTDPDVEAHPLDADEELVCHAAFGALTGHQRALVQVLQTSTDVQALRQFELVNLAREDAATKDALRAAQADEIAAVDRELVDLTDAVLSHDDVGPKSDHVGVETWLGELHALQHRLRSDSKNPRQARIRAKAAVDASNARVAAQTQAVADTSEATSAAESAIERELGPDAVHRVPTASPRR